MFELKPMSKGGITGALTKAERYRLINEPWEAESICRDVLGVDPGNQQALILLLLAITDRFGGETGSDVSEARALLPKLQGEYEPAYFAGIVCERQAKAMLEYGTLGCGPAAYDWLREAMSWYEKAEELSPPGNDDPVLRWNTCARMIMRHELRPAPGPPRGV